MAGSIREYRNPVNGLNVSDRPAALEASVGESASSTAAGIGRDIGGGISALGAPAEAGYKRFVVQPDLNRLDTLATYKLDDLSTQWNNLASQNPDDPTVADTFKEKVLEPALEKLQDVAQTQEGRQRAVNLSNSLREHFFTTMAADMNTRASTAAILNANTIANNLANSASKDWTSLPLALKMHDEALKNSVVGLDPSNAARVLAAGQQDEKEIVAGALLGLMQRDPEQFQKDMEAGKFDKETDSRFTPAEKAQFVTAAETVLKSHKALAAAGKREAAQASKDAVGRTIMSAYDQETGRVNVPKDYVQRIQNDKTILDRDKPAAVRAITQLLKTGPAGKDTPGLVNSIIGRLQFDERYDGNVDRDALTSELQKYVDADPASGHVLTRASYNFLNGLINPKDANASKIETLMLHKAASLYDPPNPFWTPPTADQIATQKKYDAWFLPAYLQKLNEGKKPTELLDPNSPDYLPKQFDAKAGPDVPLLSPPLNNDGGVPPPTARPPIEDFFKGILGGGPKPMSYSPDDSEEPDPLDQASTDGTEGSGAIVQAQKGVRSLPISKSLSSTLTAAAEAAKVRVVVFSGGQHSNEPGEGTGSTRHNGGNAADIHLYANGRQLDFDKPADRPAVVAFVKEAIANGATGIGAGDGYMGTGIHVGYGPNGQRGGKVVVWGAKGRGSNAPKWLREAAGEAQMAST